MWQSITLAIPRDHGNNTSASNEEDGNPSGHPHGVGEVCINKEVRVTIPCLVPPSGAEHLRGLSVREGDRQLSATSMNLLSGVE